GVPARVPRGRAALRVPRRDGRGRGGLRRLRPPPDRGGRNPARRPHAGAPAPARRLPAAPVFPYRCPVAGVRGRARARRRARRRGLVLAGAAAVVLVAAWYWGRDLSLWSVDSVRVTGATGQDAAQIEAALQSAARGMTTLHVRAGALHDAVARFPIVKALRVHTSFPHGVRIEVVENAPVAALMATGSPVAVTADGTLLRDRPTAGLPLVPAHSVPTGPRVTDAQAAGAIALAAAAPAGVRG